MLFCCLHRIYVFASLYISGAIFRVLVPVASDVQKSIAVQTLVIKRFSGNEGYMMSSLHCLADGYVCLIWNFDKVIGR
jgi:hypothetical protein